MKTLHAVALALSLMVPAIGVQAKWITKAIAAVVETPDGSIELPPEAEEAWLDESLYELDGS